MLASLTWTALRGPLTARAPSSEDSRPGPNLLKGPKIAFGFYVSRDPLGQWGDPSQLGNAYGFVGANVVNGLDPYGLDDDDLDALIEKAKIALEVARKALGALPRYAPESWKEAAQETFDAAKEELDRLLGLKEEAIRRAKEEADKLAEKLDETLHPPLEIPIRGQAPNPVRVAKGILEAIYEDDPEGVVEVLDEFARGSPLKFADGPIDPLKDPARYWNSLSREEKMKHVAYFGMGWWIVNRFLSPGDAGGGGFKPFDEEFDSPEDAIGETSPRGVTIEDQMPTTNPDLKSGGYTETRIISDSAGKRWTVHFNPSTGKWAGAHPSGEGSSR